MRIPATLCLLLILAGGVHAAEIPVTSQSLTVRFDPATHTLSGQATLTLARPATSGEAFSFRIHHGLHVRGVTRNPAGVGERLGLEGSAPQGWWRTHTVLLPAGLSQFTVWYGGEIYDAVEKAGDLSFVVGDDTRGVIGEEGIFLVAGSGWYPVTEGVTAFKSIEVDVPDALRAVTQGGLVSREVKDGRELTEWSSDIPVDGLALQAGKYHVDSRKVGEVTISTYLFESDRRHATFILDQIEKYLKLYEPLLGRYPWPKFDVVSNFFTTGYGMPSYTLLGSNVIQVMVRMAPRYGGNIPPGFVDHELVHCWWGNYVYPDYATGNWCEGLTSYCSNYLAKELENADKATVHRKKVSVNFAIRVQPEEDYPLRAFRGKTEDFENDIGYGKGLMLFHMLRNRVGDETFWGVLRGIVRDFGGKATTWGDFEKAYSAAAGEDLAWFFTQWLDRKGAPALELGEVTAEPTTDGKYLVRGEILQEGKPWRLRVPVRIRLDGEPADEVVEVTGAKTSFTFEVPGRPGGLGLDPDFHLFRHVPREEIQPCLNLTLERPDKVYVVPPGETPYRRLAAMAARSKPGEVVVGTAALPDKDCVLYGTPKENPAVATALAAAAVRVGKDSVIVNSREYKGNDLWLVLSMPHPEAKGRYLTVFLALTEKALRGARLIYHFGWDGFVAYAGRPLGRGDFTRVTPATEGTVTILGSSEVRIKKVIDDLSHPGLEGRLAGSKADATVREYLKTRLGAAGVTGVREVPFSFTVKDHTDPDAWTVRQGRLSDGEAPWTTSYPGTVVPAVFSPEAPEGIVIKRIAMAGGEVDGETLLLFPAVETLEDLLEAIGPTMKGTARPAAIAFSLKCLEHRELSGLAAYPSRPPERLKGKGNPWPACGAMQAAAPETPQWLTCPVVFLDPRLLPPGAEGPANAVLRVRFEEREIQSANLVGEIPAGADGARAVGLSAHYDGLGKGHQGADDNASGVAAVLEAARLLSARSGELAAPVRVILFGAEEWGLCGSKALAAETAEELSVLVNLDTVGAKDAEEVFLIGRSHYPEFAKAATSAFEAEGFKIGRDIDRFAFRRGSDHWPFHEAGIPALDIFSGQYRRMNTKEDVRDLVSPAKVARVARAVADLAAHLASTAPAEDETVKVTMFPEEDRHLTNLRMLTRGGENAECYYAPDTPLFCFQSKRGELAADQIFVMGLDGAGQRMVSNGKGATTCSFLFPGAKRVLYATTMYFGDKPPAPPDQSKGYVWMLHPEFDLVAHDLDGKNPVRLTDTWRYDAEATLSPDGKWIVFTSCRDNGDPEIYKMKADGSEVTRLTNAKGYDGGPFFSPDGTKIVWRANRPETEKEKAEYKALVEEGLVSRMVLEIYVMNADGTDQRRVTDLKAASFAPYMHPDGKRIIFCSNLATLGKRGMPNFDLWLVNTDGTGLTRVTTGPDFDGFPMFSYDGKRLVFCSNRDNGGTRETNIFTADWED